MATLEDKVKKQIEFYFSDSNFPRDKFLRSLSAQNEEGFVPIATLLTFKKLSDLTKDVKVIVSSVADSDIVAVNSDQTSIKRKHPLPENDTSLERTIYAKGWKEATTLEDIEKTFSSFGKILSVRIRRLPDKKPKDSAFIEFSTVEEAKAAAAAKSQQDGKDLIVMLKADYSEMKKKEKNEQKELKRKGDGEAEGDEPKSKKKTKKEIEDKPIEYTPGVMISMKNIGGGVTREILREIFEPFGKVEFVDFNQNDTEGYIRYKEADFAKKALADLVENKKQIGNQVPELSILEGEAESEYYKKVKILQNQKKSKSTRGKKRRRF